MWGEKKIEVDAYDILCLESACEVWVETGDRENLTY